MPNAGEAGFGVGICSEEFLAKSGASEFKETQTLGSQWYGNYKMPDGSVMVFIPAFVYKIGEKNALEISYDVNLAGTDGWILHRAFINARKQIEGFLIDKYLCSVREDNKGCQSVKNADPLTLSLRGSRLIDNEDCIGRVSDALILAKLRGENYCVVSCFAYSALRMLAMAHAQASIDTKNCAWFNQNFCFPKGNTQYLKDYFDVEIEYQAADNFPQKRGKTGSGKPFAKTTHNGQACGVADLVGSLLETGIGIAQSSDIDDLNLYVFKSSQDLRKIDSESIAEHQDWFEPIPFTKFPPLSGKWDENQPQFSNQSSGIEWALNGVYPKSISTNTECKFMQGQYIPEGIVRKRKNPSFNLGGTYMTAERSGLWQTTNKDHMNSSLSSTGFRTMYIPD